MASSSHMFCNKNKLILQCMHIGNCNGRLTINKLKTENALRKTFIHTYARFTVIKNVKPFNHLVYSALVPPVLSNYSKSNINNTLSFTNKRFNTGITDDILKTKIKEQSQNDPPKDKPGDTDQKDDANKKKSYLLKNSWKLGLAFVTTMGTLTAGYLLYTWGSPEKDKDGNDIRDEFSDLPIWQAYVQRFSKQYIFFKQMIQEPSSKKLLPDPVKEPYYQPPYTVVFELTGVLVHPEWSIQTGWRFKKRPNIDYLFNVLQSPGLPLFEIVIYTHEGGMTAYPIVDGIDPQNHVSYRLFRDATRYINGSHCKDLSCLNRDESKVIIVDCDPKAVQLQPRNAVNLRKWFGEDNDSGLVDLGNFLRTIAASNVGDVRTVLDYYNQYDDPLQAFREKQKQLQEQQELASRSEQSKSKGFVGSWAAGFGRRGH